MIFFYDKLVWSMAVNEFKFLLKKENKSIQILCVYIYWRWEYSHGILSYNGTKTSRYTYNRKSNTFLCGGEAGYILSSDETKYSRHMSDPKSNTWP